MAKINHFVMGTKVMALDNIEVKKGAHPIKQGD